MNKKMIYIIAGLAGVIILAGGAFFAMRLMNNGQNAQEGGGGMKMSIGSSGPGGSKSFSIDLVPAPEVPAQEADARGLIKSLKDDNFIVQGGNNMIVAKNEDGEVSVQSDGPSNEVVITKDTKIYRDVTFDTHEPSGDEKIQQVIEPMEAEEIEKNDMVNVWGSKRGDRLIADFILLTRPVILNRGEGK